MRFHLWLLREEDSIIQKALGIKEPEVGVNYDESEVADNLETIRIAIGKQTEEISSLRKSGSNEEKLEASRSMLSDLQDKEEKWKNWKSEVKSKGPNPEPEVVAKEEPKEEEE